MQITLNKMHDKKFKEQANDKTCDMEELKECDGYREYYNLKAAEVNELQNMVKCAIGPQFEDPYEN